MSDRKLDLSAGSTGSLFSKLQQIQSSGSGSAQSNQSSVALIDDSSTVGKALLFDSLESSDLALELNSGAVGGEDPISSEAICCDISQVEEEPIAPKQPRRGSGDLSIEGGSGDERAQELKVDFARTPSDAVSIDVWERASQESPRSETAREPSPIQQLSEELSASETNSTNHGQMAHVLFEDENSCTSDDACERSPVCEPTSSGTNASIDLDLEKGYVKRMKEKHEARDIARAPSWSDRVRHRQSSVPLTDKEQHVRELDVKELQERTDLLEQTVVEQENQLRAVKAEKEAAEKDLIQQMERNRLQFTEEISRLNEQVQTTKRVEGTAHSMGWRVEGHEGPQGEGSGEPSTNCYGDGVDWKAIAESRAEQLGELRNVVSALEQMLEVEKGRADGLEEELQAKAAQVEELEHTIAPLEALRASYMSVLDPSGWPDEWKDGGLEREDSSGSDRLHAFPATISPISTPPSAVKDVKLGNLTSRPALVHGGASPLTSPPPALAALPSAFAPAGRSPPQSNLHAAGDGLAVTPVAPVPRNPGHLRTQLGSGVLGSGVSAGRSEDEDAEDEGWEATLHKSKECVGRICLYLDQLVGAAGASTDFRELHVRLSMLGEELRKKDHRLAAALSSSCSCSCRSSGSPCDREEQTTPRFLHCGANASALSSDRTSRGDGGHRRSDVAASSAGGKPTGAKAESGSKSDKDRTIKRLEGRVQDLREKMSSHRLKYTKKVTILLAALRERESQLSSILEQASYTKSGPAASQDDKVAVLSGLRGR